MWRIWVIFASNEPKICLKNRIKRPRGTVHGLPEWVYKHDKPWDEGDYSHHSRRWKTSVCLKGYTALWLGETVQAIMQHGGFQFCRASCDTGLCQEQPRGFNYSPGVHSTTTQCCAAPLKESFKASAEPWKEKCAAPAHTCSFQSDRKPALNPWKAVKGMFIWIACHFRNL